MARTAAAWVDEELDDETRAQFLAQLRGQVARMRKLATELLDLSRLESGALEQARTSKEGFVPEKPRPGQLPPQKGTR